MTERRAYSDIILSRGMHILSSGYFYCFIFMLILLFPIRCMAQEVPVYDEISVYLEVPRIGGGDISAVISGEDLFLPVTDLFDFLKIRNVPTSGLDSISGFFIDQKAVFSINRTGNFIRYQGKVYNLEKGDLIRTESNLYLRTIYFGKVFGLDCIFNFRSLAVTVNTKLELPVIREMRQEEMRRNIARLKGEIKADTNIGRSYPLFRFGMADWSAIATEEINGKSEARLNLALGAMVAGGEATASLNYNSGTPFREKQQFYQWRFVDNDFKPLRQVVAGKIAVNAISSIYNPVIGVQLTNTPTTFRRSFGTYTLSDKTEPGWIVELYVNNVLVDYIKADASGFFTFQVPLVYGNSTVQLRFFGPWGEERTREQNISIPFNFLPKNTLEYNIGAGIVEDSVGSRFSRANINYGVTRSLTVGGGVEYLSSVKSGPAMPYINASFSVLNNLLISGEYTYGVRARSTLTYRMPSNLQIDLNYTRYDKNQKAINYNYVEERKAVVSLPLKIKKFSSFQRFTVYQIILPASKYTTGEWMFSASAFGINTNISTYSVFVGSEKPSVYSNLSLSMKAPLGFVLMPQVQYSYTQNQLLTAKLGLEKHLFDHGFMNMSYEQNFRSNYRMAELGFRYDFSFAQTGASVRHSDKKTSLIQYARGSLIYDRKTKYLGSDNRTNVGKGGISIIPYLDLNSNGTRDPGEPKVFGLKVRASGGRTQKSEPDSTIRILGLEPYTNCFIDLDPNSFENVAWKLPVQTMSVSVDPDILKHIEIPVTVVGEASGHVTLQNRDGKEGSGRMIINFYKGSLKPAGRTLTEDDGYFSYIGLAPGSYTVRVDSAQLKKLGLISDPESLKFTIASGKDGDMVENLDFNLKRKVIDTLVIIPVIEKPVIRKDTSIIIVHELIQELVTISEDSYAIQLGAFQKKSNAETLQKNLQKLLGRKVEIVIEKDLYKVRINELKDRTEVDKVIELLRKNGITELWLISLKAKQQQLIISQKQDTITKISETITNVPVPGKSDEITIQAGAFRQESNAIGLKDKLSLLKSHKVQIVNENGFYKLRLIGSPFLRETILEEMKVLMPLLKLDLKDLWVLPVQPKTEEQIPEISRPENVELNKVDNEIKVSLPVNKTSPLKLTENTLDAPVSSNVPTISIQAGVFVRRSDALRAQRKITSSLKRPVEIVKQWEYYKVIIPGFFTREETYKYYPELAGLGYPGVSLIEE